MGSPSRPLRDRIRAFCGRHHRTCAFLFGIALSIAALLCLEVACLIGNLLRTEENSEYRYRGNYHGVYWNFDELLGYRGPSDAVLLATHTVDDEVVYEVQYSFDAEGRRITPARAAPGRDRFAMFFGGSFVFGQGLNDHETIPFFFCDSIVKYKPYNFGFHGYGPNSMLVTFEELDIRNIVRENDGILVYVYLPDQHVRRAIGSMIAFNGWSYDMAYYELDDSGIPRRNGSFTTGRPSISSWYHRIDRLNTMRFFEIDVPPILMSKHYRLTAKIIDRSRDLFIEEYPNGKFLVLIYPSPEKRVPIIPHFVDLGIQFLDYSDLFDPDSPEYQIPKDGHPSALAAKTIAARLADDLAR